MVVVLVVLVSCTIKCASEFARSLSSDSSNRNSDPLKGIYQDCTIFPLGRKSNSSSYQMKGIVCFVQLG